MVRILQSVLVVALVASAAFAGVMGYTYVSAELSREDQEGPSVASEPPPGASSSADAGDVTDTTHESHLAVDFGRPAPAGEDADIYGVEILESGEWAPEKIAAAVGEPVTLQITNSGTVARECALGDEDYQDAYAAAFATGEAPEGENVLSLEAGGSTELTWVFELPGKALLTCHDEGQYGEGKVATINIR